MEDKKRQLNIDVLRILACFFVVMAHASSSASETALNSLQGITLHTLNAVGHTGTILFFAISGMFLLSDKYDFSFKKFYSNNFLKLLVAYITWVVIYHLIGFAERGIYTPAHLKEVIVNIIYGKVYYHFWYLPMLLGIYIILPFLRAICHSGKKLVLYFMILFLAVQVIFPTILFFDFPYRYYLASIVTRIPFTLVNHHVGYFIMGYALVLLLQAHKLPKPRLIATILIITGPVIGLLGDYLLVLQKGYHEVTLNTFFSATLCFSAIGWFILLHEWKIEFNETAAKWIRGISRLTFGIYILHPIIMDHLVKWIPFLEGNHAIPIVLLMTLVTFLLSMLITWIFARIPFVRKWILFG